MKYIRTKDGIAKIIKETILPVGNEIFYTTTDGFCYSYQVIAQANTIEELCDEFVIVNNADERPFRINCDTFYREFKATGYTCLDYAIERFNKLKEFVGSAKNHNKEVDYLYKDNPNYEFNGCIKGAIWTDKGLIYKAKMKGVLSNGDIDWELL